MASYSISTELKHDKKFFYSLNIEVTFIPLKRKRHYKKTVVINWYFNLGSKLFLFNMFGFYFISSFISSGFLSLLLSTF